MCRHDSTAGSCFHLTMNKAVANLFLLLYDLLVLPLLQILFRLNYSVRIQILDAATVSLICSTFLTSAAYWWHCQFCTSEIFFSSATAALLWTDPKWLLTANSAKLKMSNPLHMLTCCQLLTACQWTWYSCMSVCGTAVPIEIRDGEGGLAWLRAVLN